MAASTCRVLQLAQMKVSVLLDQKVYLSHFPNAKYVGTRFVKIKEYAHKKKKQWT